MLGLFLIWRGGIPDSIGLSQSVYGQGEAQGHGGEGADHGVLSAGPLEEWGRASCPGCPVSRASGHQCGEDRVPQVPSRTTGTAARRNRVRRGGQKKPRAWGPVGSGYTVLLEHRCEGCRKGRERTEGSTCLAWDQSRMSFLPGSCRTGF